MLMLRYLLLAPFFSLFLIVAPVVAEPLKVGVAPSNDDSVALAKLWIPFLEKLERKSGISLRFSTAPDLLEFSRRLSNGDYDLVITNHYLYTIFSQKYHLDFVAELSQNNQDNTYALVASPSIHHVSELKGSLIAIKYDEAKTNIQSLDAYLTTKGVMALRDGLPSYNKILESVDEELHLGGWVPMSAITSAEQRYNILWQTNNESTYIMSSATAKGKVLIHQLLASLRDVQSLMGTERALKDISILSIKPAGKHTANETSSAGS